MDKKERQIVLKVLGGKIAKVCDNPEEASFSFSYHSVKGKEYPALAISCKGRYFKIHINQAEWRALIEERKRLKLMEAKKCLEKLPLPSGATAEDYTRFLTFLKDFATRESIWKQLMQFEEIKRSFQKVCLVGENAEVKVFDIEPANLLKVEILKKDPVRGKVKSNFWFNYLGKKGNFYAMDINKFWQLSEEGIKTERGWILRKIHNKIRINL